MEIERLKERFPLKQRIMLDVSTDPDDENIQCGTVVGYDEIHDPDPELIVEGQLRVKWDDGKESEVDPDCEDVTKLEF